MSLRWNDHGQTFFSMLSSVRKREVYCDVTLACDGRFYPVHKLVLSTCSDFFDQMFEKTACKHPVIVMANIAHKDLEALLNYMYLGEVNVLQTELSALMKAAEMLRIKGLAEPTKGLSAKDTREGKRTISWDKDLPDSKRRKSEEIPGSVSRLFQSSVSESDRTTNTRDTQKSRIANSDSQNSRLSIQIPTRCESSSSSSTDQIGTSSTEPPSQPTSQEAGASSQADPSFEPVDKPPRPEVKMEEVLVKEEPSSWFPDTEEGLESLQYSEPDTSLEYSSQQTNYQAGCLPWELAATQAQTLDTRLSQNIPGPSRIQGDILDFQRQERWTQYIEEQRERYRKYEATKRSRNFVESWRLEFEWVYYDTKRRVMTCTTCLKYGTEEDRNSRFVSGNTNFKRLALVRHQRSRIHRRCEARRIAELGPDATEGHHGILA